MAHIKIFEEFEIPEGSKRFGFYRKNKETKKVARKPFYIAYVFTEEEAWKDYEDYESRAHKLKEDEEAIMKMVK